MDDLYLALQVNCDKLLKAIDNTKLEATEVSRADLQSALNQLDAQIQSEGMHTFYVEVHKYSRKVICNALLSNVFI